MTLAMPPGPSVEVCGVPRLMLSRGEVIVVSR